MTDVHVFATIRPKLEFFEEVQSVLNGIVASTRLEPGCLRFELNRRINGDTSLHLVEIWQSEKALRAHHAMSYTVKAAERIADKLAVETEVIEMTMVE